MKRKVDGTTWKYCDCEGFWWREDNKMCVSRSEKNQNIWCLWDGKDYLGRMEFPSMKKAMQEGYLK